MAKLSPTSKRHLCEAVAFALVLLLLAPGVQAGVRKAVDGFIFEGPQFIRTDFAVKVVEYDSADAVTQAAVAAGAEIAPSVAGGHGRLVQSRVQAWSRLRDGTCEIHIVKATVKYQPEFLGHELTHCIYGRWHR